MWPVAYLGGGGREGHLMQVGSLEDVHVGGFRALQNVPRGCQQQSGSERPLGHA